MSRFSAAIGVARPVGLLAAGVLLLAACGVGTSNSPGSGGKSGGKAPSGCHGSGSGSQGGSGCQGGSGGSGGQGGSGGLDTTLFPATVGNTWVYEDSLAVASNQKGTTTNKITAVVPDSGGEKVTISTVSKIAGLPTKPAALTYQFNSDGSIGVPLSQLGNSSTSVKIKSGGIVWPSRAVLESGQPHTSTLGLQISAAGHTLNVDAHVTVKGEGNQHVTVPAGSYTATLVDETITEAVSGVTVTIEVQTWLANGVGPVKTVASTKTGTGARQVVATDLLKTFKHG
jgi:hypothetical protein